eukprot:7930139-Prorocentrum_lima.AAC.1
MKRAVNNLQSCAIRALDIHLLRGAQVRLPVRLVAARAQGEAWGSRCCQQPDAYTRCHGYVFVDIG